MLGSYKDGDIAVFSIFDPMTHSTVFEKEIPTAEEVLEFSFSHNDTVKLEPKRYVWDIKIYRNPQRDEDGLLIGGDEIDSYYAAFSLPICEIKEVAQNV